MKESCEVTERGFPLPELAIALVSSVLRRGGPRGAVLDRSRVRELPPQVRGQMLDVIGHHAAERDRDRGRLPAYKPRPIRCDAPHATTTARRTRGSASCSPSTRTEARAGAARCAHGIGSATARERHPSRSTGNEPPRRYAAWSTRRMPIAGSATTANPRTLMNKARQATNGNRARMTTSITALVPGIVVGIPGPSLLCDHAASGHRFDIRSSRDFPDGDEGLGYIARGNLRPLLGVLRLSRSWTCSTERRQVG
jgi:hypothetical protein